MKKLYYTALFAAALVVTSCGDWLDVNPRAQIKQSALYSTEEGFQSSLNGVYSAMGEAGMYGFAGTILLPESFAHHWTIPNSTSSNINRLSNFDYSNQSVEPVIEGMWIAYYNAIAQLNDLLANLEGPEVKFGASNRALLEGEARGLRAFIHFDLLRIFGPMPINANKSAIAIPYVTEMSVDPQKSVSLTYGEVLAKIEEDLNAAERILGAEDPLVFNSKEALDGTLTNAPISANDGSVIDGKTDQWHRLRQGRFNYYACLAARARFCQWTGDKTTATEYAKKVVEAKNPDGTPKFALATESEYQDDKANLTMFCEQLFGLQLSREMQTTLKDKTFDVVATLYSQLPSYLEECYENRENPDDIRFRRGRYWEEKTEGSFTTNYFRKFTGNETISIPTNRRMPMIRLAEMYLIIIENLPVAEAQPWFSTFRIARAMGVATENSFASGGEAGKIGRVEKEYRKDFFGEGQMYFFYKRLNYKTYTWPMAYNLPANAYAVPKPDSQTVFE